LEYAIIRNIVGVEYGGQHHVLLNRETTMRYKTRRSGNVAVAFALCLVMITGFLALSLDGGQLLDHRRQAQSTADAAALAAADQLYKTWFSYYGLDDPNQSAKKAALAAASDSGFTHGRDGCTVEVYIPPVTGPFAGLSGHAEVIITTSQQRDFSKIWSSDPIAYGARAVSRGRRSTIKQAIICLDPTGKGALNAAGNGTATIQDGPIQVNSSDSSAMIANGNGSLTATAFDVVGSPGYTTPGGGSFSGSVISNTAPLPDPLAGLPEPDPSTLTVQSIRKLQLSGNKKNTLDPGLYIGGISITGGDVVLNPGLYYMQGGGFSLGGQATLTGVGVMIYNASTSTSDKIDISGQGAVTLSPPTTGPYKGFVLFQDRTSNTPVNISGSSGVAMSITGTFYAAAATLSVSGNGAQQMIGSQYISYDLVLSGNGTYKCVWSPNLTPGIREILLVE
jgi:hypothetical protein